MRRGVVPLGLRHEHAVAVLGEELRGVLAEDLQRARRLLAGVEAQQPLRRKELIAIQLAVDGALVPEQDHPAPDYARRVRRITAGRASRRRGLGCAIRPRGEAREPAGSGPSDRPTRAPGDRGPGGERVAAGSTPRTRMPERAFDAAEQVLVVHDVTRRVGEDRDGGIDDAAAAQEGGAGQLGLERVGLGGELVRDLAQPLGLLAQRGDAVRSRAVMTRNCSGISTPYASAITRHCGHTSAAVSCSATRSNQLLRRHRLWPPQRVSVRPRAEVKVAGPIATWMWTKPRSWLRSPSRM